MSELEELVRADMLLAGFDPDDPNEVRKYWAARGVRKIVPIDEDNNPPTPQLLTE